MCGIHASISTRGFRPPSSDLKQLLCHRGPDHVGEAQTKITNDETIYSLSFTSTVLALRGGHIQVQPFVNTETGSILCWNGEAWKFGSQPVIGNDGQQLFELLLEAGREKLPEAATLDVLRSVVGPFAFVFLDKTRGQLYFGRDRLGRRSLLYNTKSSSLDIEFASTSRPGDSCWREVEADGIYQLSFGSSGGLHNFDEHLLTTSPFPLERRSWGSPDLTSPLPSNFTFNRNISSEVNALNVHSGSVRLLNEHLRESLKLRILNVLVPPGLHEASSKVRIAILFSGGLDCTVLARVVHDLLPSDQQIDLLNVAFENPRVVQAAKARPLKSKKQKKADQNSSSKTHDIGMPATPAQESPQSSPYESCPDRETGRKSFAELQRVCSDRVWRFVAVDIPYTETMAHRSNVVNLIYPHNTEMDLSIAFALYFASRGTGIAASNLARSPEAYESPARVLLSGLGADELFGGYTRHATAFNKNGFPGLLHELELDVNRLGKRNLGRDDRVISHWGREARFPFLDESLVKWAVECPIWEKCGFQITTNDEMTTEVSEETDIEPGKKVLRLLAYQLGMESVAKEKKRAIQFGARTAKMEVGRTKGTTLIS